MILPASYANGFAPRDDRPLYPSLWQGCVGAWAPCLGPTGLTLRDSSGFGNHGTLTNMDAASDWVPSNGRYALDFDGTNDYVYIRRSGSNIYSELVGNKTVCGWVRTSSPGASYRTVFSKDNTFSLTIKSGVFITYDWAVSTDRSSGVTVSDGLWHHLSVNVVAGVTNGSTLYVDGREVAKITYLSQAGNATNDVTICAALDSTNANVVQYINAAVDDLRLYKRCLTANETRLLASCRGIAYELAPRRRSSSAIAAFNRRRRLICGANC